MTATLLTLTLFLNASPVEDRSARLVESAEPPSRLTLLETRNTLVEQAPSIKGAMGLLIGSGSLSVATVLLGLGMDQINAFGGLRGGSSIGMIFSTVMVVLLAIVGAASVAMGIVGSWMLAKKLKEREAHEVEVKRIDAELARAVDYTAWPSPPPMVQAP